MKSMLRFAEPSRVVRDMKLRRGSRVADFGTGSGYYAYAVSQAVGPEGRVYAIDILPGLLEDLGKSARSAQIGNIEVLEGDLEKKFGSLLPDGSVDAVIVSNILFELDKPESLPAEALRVLREGGHAYVIDWRDSFSGMGPARERVVSEDRARELFSEFAFLRPIDAGVCHYGLTFRKK